MISRNSGHCSSMQMVSYDLQNMTSYYHSIVTL